MPYGTAAFVSQTPFYFYKGGTYVSIAIGGTLSGSLTIPSVTFSNPVSYDLIGSIVAYTVNINGSAVEIDGPLASLTAEQDANTNYGGVTIDSSGTLTVADGGAAIVGNVIDIGVNGLGSLNVVSSGSVVVGNGVIVGINAQGSLDVTTGGSIAVANFVDVGDSAPGILDVTSGGVVSVSDLGVGIIDTGAVSVDGVGSTISVTEALDIGDAFAAGMLSITNGGSVEANRVLVGFAYTPGTVSVDGLNSTLSDAGDLIIGQFFPDSSVINRIVSVADGGLISAGRIVIYGNGVVTGNGSVSGNILNEGSIAATGGTLTLVNGTLYGGPETIASLSALDIEDAVSGSTVVFADGTGTLAVGDLSTFSAAISSFQQGDTIDVKGIRANDETFDPNSGLLSVYHEDWGAGASPTLVGTLTFTGLPDTTAFALAGDGNGGTDVTFGTPAPTIANLADLADVVYDPGFGSGSYTYVAQYPDASNGFLAEEFMSGSQIVISIRGTDNLNNYLADGSWLQSSPNTTLGNDVRDAAIFLDQVRHANQTDTITLTGHSLGGAVAQLLGLASNYAAVGFDAPGASQFFSALTPQLQHAFANSDSFQRLSANYRTSGDQVSLAGAAIGQQYTVTSKYPNSWLYAIANHSIDLLSSQIDLASQGNPNVSIVPGVQDLPLAATDLASESLRSTTASQAVYNVITAVSAISHFYSFDPSQYSSYTLVGTATSPDISAVILPAVPGVASYLVSFEGSNGTWSADQTALPNATLATPPGTAASGVRFFSEDAAGDPVPLPDDTYFQVAFNSTGTFDGTLTEDVACFCRGTHIATPTGEVLIEMLRVGDRVLTVSGAARPIQWIGIRRFGGRFTAGHRNILPIAIRSGAIDQSIPIRDLFVSPQHAMLLDGVLIPARDLVNGVSIVQLGHVQDLEYLHIELATHDAIYAEGAASETFVDDGSRGMFSNVLEFRTGHPDHNAVPAVYCAPRVTEGFGLEAVWRRLKVRADLAHASSAAMKSSLAG